MKKLPVMILAAALTLSAAGCSSASDSAGALDISSPEVSNTTVSSQPAVTEEPADPVPPSEPEPPVITTPASGKENDIIAPSSTEAQELAKTDYSDYSYFSSGQEYDHKTQLRKVYEGEITDGKIKQQIFTALCDVIQNCAIVPRGEQQVSGGASAQLTLKSKEGAEYKLCSGLLIQHPGEEGGDEIYILECPNSILYFGKDSALDEFIRKGVMTEQNLISEKKAGGSEENQSSGHEIAYLSLYSNFAWEDQIRGTFTTTDGTLYSFDLSGSYEPRSGVSFEQSICDILCKGGSGTSTPTGAFLDPAILREGLAYAAKIDPDANVTCEHAMCDYGQKTFYAVVNGKPVMLRSKGDNDMTVEDENAEASIRCYENAVKNALTTIEFDD